MLLGMTGPASDPTLGQVVDALGGATVELLTPGCRQVRVGGPRLWDGADVAGLAPGDVVLGVNVTADPDLVRRAAAAAVSAVALKGDLRPLAEEAERLGVGLLAVAAEVSW